MYITFNKPGSNRKNLFIKDDAYDNAIQLCESLCNYIDKGFTSTDIFFNVSKVLTSVKGKLPLKIEKVIIFEGKGYKYEDTFPIEANWDKMIVFIDLKKRKAELFTMEDATVKSKKRN